MDTPPREWPAAPADAQCPRDLPKTIVVVPESLDTSSARALRERVAALLERREVDVVTCDVAATGTADLATIDSLARLQLTARRLGRTIRLRHAPGPLVDLIELTGLSSVLPCGPETVAAPSAPVDEPRTASVRRDAFRPWRGS